MSKPTAEMKDVGGDVPGSTPTAGCSPRRGAKHRRQHAQVRAGHPQGTGRQGPRRGLHRQRRTIGTRCWPSGPARRARTSTWRSRAATTSSRAASASRRPRSTTASCSTARRAASIAAGSQAGGRGPQRQVRQAAGGQGLCQQAALEHRLQATDAAAAGRLDFDIWLGPAPQQPYPREPRALQLALVLGLRQRRDRQPGRPPDGHRPLGHARGHAAQERDSASAAASATRTRAKRPTPN